MPALILVLRMGINREGQVRRWLWWSATRNHCCALRWTVIFRVVGAQHGCSSPPSLTCLEELEQIVGCGIRAHSPSPAPDPIIGTDRCPAQQGPHLGLELLLAFDHPLVAHGLALAGIGSLLPRRLPLHLGAIVRHLAQAHQLSFLAELQHLNKQSSQGSQVAAAKITDSAVVRLLIAG